MKNKKTKYYLKNNLIGLIIGGIIFGSLGVYAAITFPSNEVSFDPSNSTLKSTNVKDAIDELYEKCTNPQASDQIIEDAGLEKDPYECRYFFTGANPNNYITFNGEEAGWRIISVECDGTIKILKNEDIDDAAAWTYLSNGKWNEELSLRESLNEDYYNEIRIESQKQITEHDWSIGTIDNPFDNNLEGQINKENSIKWKDKLALPTVSEYIRTNSNVNQCGNIELIHNNYNICKQTNWMFNLKINYWWTLGSNTEQEHLAYFIEVDGDIHNGSKANKYSVRPALYLSSDIQITGGTGTQSDPYTIE